MRKNIKTLTLLLIISLITLSGCGKTVNVGDYPTENTSPTEITEDQVVNQTLPESITIENGITPSIDDEEVIFPSQEPIVISPEEDLSLTIIDDNEDLEYIGESIAPSNSDIYVTLDSGYNFNVPEYTGDAWVYVNENVPFFTKSDYTLNAFEYYSDLDYLGRCGVAYANICKELMPTEQREGIGQVKPTGWVQNKYDWVDGLYLYNRCHLIGFQLAGENANPKNLITGTRYLNIDGMLDFENEIAEYVKRTNHHCLYRVTPIFGGENLLCYGLLMEAQSIEDNEVSFCVYAFNVQPNVVIDYKTGNNRARSNEDYEIIEDNDNLYIENTATTHYIINTNSNKFHLETCSKLPAENNRKDVDSTREELINAGYSPCGICKP